MITNSFNVEVKVDCFAHIFVPTMALNYRESVVHSVTVKDVVFYDGTGLYSTSPTYCPLSVKLYQNGAEVMFPSCIQLD